MTTLKILVTKDCLEKSKMCGFDYNIVTSQSCAVAYAVRFIFPRAYVSYYSIYPFGRSIDEKKEYLNNNIIFNEETTKWIKLFDALLPEDRMQMEEYEFEVNIPDCVIEKISLEELKPLLVNHPTLEFVNL